jgi:hypothetical protein
MNSSTNKSIRVWNRKYLCGWKLLSIKDKSNETLNDISTKSLSLSEGSYKRVINSL